jgi:molybdopterin molybdotransferase
VKTTGVVLAGGRSSRMGSDKSLLPFLDKPLICQVVNELREVVEEILIVSNRPGKYGFTGAKEIGDIYPGMGPLGGIHAGLAAAENERIFVCACDMPFITGRLVRFMLEMSRGFDAAVPRMSNNHLQPLFAVYSKACLWPVEKCLRDGISKIIEFYRLVNIKYVDEAAIREIVEPEKAFFNVNTLEDYRKIKDIKIKKSCGTTVQGRSVSLEDARSALLQVVKPLTDELVPLDQALGRVLGQDILAGENVPPFDRSSLDGYALRSRDTEDAGLLHPVALEVIDKVPAGCVSGKKVMPGTAVQIMTGAPVPAGADAVVGKEEINRDGEYINITRRVKVGSNIVGAGEELAAGDLAAARGTVVTPVLAGLLASLGVQETPCYRRPRVAVISTGDELVDAGLTPVQGKIRSSNSFILEGFCRRCHVEPLVLGNVKDDAEEIALCIRRGLEQAEMVITTGGVSAGEYDLVKRALAVLDAEILFHQLDIKPGSPTAAAVKDGKPIVALSGSPAAAVIAFQLLVLPALKKVKGQVEYLPDVVSATLLDDYPKPSPQRRILQGRMIFKDGEACVSLACGRGIPLLGSNVLVDVPGGSSGLGAGDKVKVYLVNSIDWN